MSVRALISTITRHILTGHTAELSHAAPERGRGGGLAGFLGFARLVLPRPKRAEPHHGRRANVATVHHNPGLSFTTNTTILDFHLISTIIYYYSHPHWTYHRPEHTITITMTITMILTPSHPPQLSSQPRRILLHPPAGDDQRQRRLSTRAPAATKVLQTHGTSRGKDVHTYTRTYTRTHARTRLI